MSTKTTLLKEILTTVGGNPNELPDNLRSTIYEAIIKACGGSVDDLPDRLKTTYLKRIAEVLSGGSGGESTNQTGIIGKSWESLVNEGHIRVANGSVFANYDEDDDNNASAYALVGHLALPNDGSIYSIGTHCFTWCDLITGITIPDSVEEIGDYAFAYTGISEITIPNAVFDIFIGAFCGCSHLKSITFPAKVREISYYVCESCGTLETVTLKCPNITHIYDRAFADCFSLTNIIFEGTVAQWNSITFGEGWNENVPATEVICSDGTVSLV